MLASQLQLIAKIALLMESRDAQPPQLSLEHGAETSLLHLAKRDALSRLSQHQFQSQLILHQSQQQTATVMTNPLQNVDLTLSLHKLAETKL
jgi:hypothetical protein